MNTLVIIGMIAIGLGLLVLAVIGGLLFLRPRAPRRPRRAAPPPVPPVSDPVPRPEASSPLAGQPSMGPTPEEDDPFGHINTGVLNVRDFENFEELLAAADALTKGKDGDED